MSLQGWQVLACPKCDGRHFVPYYEAQWQSGMGTSFRPLGHYCPKCNTPVDMAKMITHAKTAEMRQKIKDLEASVG